MADPLSIASGIVGLITAAGKLASIIGDFVQNTKDAPSLATGIMTELIALKTIFHAVQKMMLDDDTGALDETRLSMISVNDLRLALMGCICVMDSLEREICGLNVNHVNGRMQKATSQTGPSRQTVAIKLKWGLKTSTLKNILNDLQRHKLTLNLMLTTINCATNSEALRTCESLKASVNGIIESNSITSRQLRFLIARQGPPTDPLSDDGPSIISSVSSALSIPLRAFESVLKRTRVYRQGHVWDDSMSLGSSVMKRTRWTTMSDLSLSEISKLAVIDLPLWPQDLWNPEYYETNIQPYEDDTDLDALQEIGSIAKPLPGLKQLLFAILDGNVDDVKDLLDGGISLTGTDRLGKAPLHWAAQSGSVEMVKLLLESGAEINAQSPEFGFTPLHCAVHIDDDKIAALFLDYGADIEARDNNGMTPLAVAAHMKHFNCARMLVERGANMLATENKNGSTPLHLAAKSGSKPIAGLLLEKGVSPLVVDNSKWITPKTYATINRDKEMRQLLSKYRSKGQVKSILSNSNEISHHQHRDESKLKTTSASVQ